MQHLWTALAEVGLLPTGFTAVDSLPTVAPGDDLLPWLVQGWDEGRATVADESAAGRRTWLLRRRDAGAKLTWGFPGAAFSRVRDWLGDRLAWWPCGVPSGRRVGVVSSRLGHELDRHKPWFAVLRTACMRIDARREILVTARSASTGKFVQRCGQLFGLPVLVIETQREESPSLSRWLERMAAPSESPDEPFYRVCLSPRLSGARSFHDALPLADRALVALSDRLLALHVRPGGNLAQLVGARLDAPHFPAASVFLALGPELVEADLAESWMARGAVGWFVMDAGQETIASHPSPWTAGDASIPSPAPIIACPSAENWPYLTHCTRRRQGPWPDEEEAHFLDDLILDRRGADHSAFAALWRIVTRRRLIATSELVRGGVPVVSFTATPLSEMGRLRTFRSHLSRWDFEPYGVCIRRDWLQTCGARPVQYGDDSLWSRLPSEERPFFQKTESRTARGKPVDWTAEREWRHVGDVPLDEIPHDAALLFVPSRAEAELLAALSPWAIAHVGRPS